MAPEVGSRGCPELQDCSLAGRGKARPLGPHSRGQTLKGLHVLPIGSLERKKSRQGMILSKEASGLTGR